MIRVSELVTVFAQVSMRAIITVDADVNAERVIVMSRNSGDTYYLFKLVGNVKSFTVPYRHTLEPTLLVGIVDDDSEYNCMFLDGVTAENVNVNAI